MRKDISFTCFRMITESLTLKFFQKALQYLKIFASLLLESFRKFARSSSTSTMCSSFLKKHQKKENTRKTWPIAS